MSTRNSKKLVYKIISMVTVSVFFWTSCVSGMNLGNITKGSYLAVDSKTILIGAMKGAAVLIPPLALQDRYARAGVDTVKELKESDKAIRRELVAAGIVSEEELAKNVSMISQDAHGNVAYYFFNVDGYFIRVTNTPNVRDYLYIYLLSREQQAQPEEKLPSGKCVQRYDVSDLNRDEIDFVLGRVWGNAVSEIISEMKSHLFPKYISDAIEKELRKRGFDESRITSVLTRGVAYFDAETGNIEKDDEARAVIAAVLSSLLNKPISSRDLKEVLSIHETLEKKIKEEKIDFGYIMDKLREYYVGVVFKEEYTPQQRKQNMERLKQNSGVTDEVAQLFDGFCRNYAYRRDLPETELLREMLVHGFVERYFFNQPLRIINKEGERKDLPWGLEQTMLEPVVGLFGKLLNLSREEKVDKIAEIYATIMRKNDYARYLFKALYRKYLAKELSPQIGKGFIPSCMLTDEEEVEYLGLIQYADLARDEDNWKTARQVVLYACPMDGGKGTSVRRKRYLASVLGEKIDTIKTGTKSSDLYIRVKYRDASGNEQEAKISILEAKVIKWILEVEAGLYKNVVLEMEIGLWKLVRDRKYILDPKGRTYDQYLREVLIPTGRMGREYRLKIKGWGWFPVVMDGEYLSTEVTVPISHTMYGVMALIDALDMELPEDSDSIEIRTIYNNDGLNNRVDPVMLGWMARNKVPIALVSTDKTGVDMKGGQFGVQDVKLLDGRLVRRPQVMELAQATLSGQENIFKGVGLSGGLGERVGKQKFNTANIMFNLSVLHPFLKELVTVLGKEKFKKMNRREPDMNTDFDRKAVQVLGREGLIEAMTPDVAANPKSKEGREFIQIEGGIASTLMNLSAFFMTTDIEEVRELKKIYFGEGPFLRIINLDTSERTRFFTPNKFAIDHWFQAESNRFRFDSNRDVWELKDAHQGNPLPLFDIEDPFYSDLQNLKEAFVNLDVSRVEQWGIRGKVKLSNCSLRGRVELVSTAGETVSKEELSRIVGDVDELWRNLIKSGYIVEEDDIGKIQNKFRELEGAFEMELAGDFEGQRDDIYNVMLHLVDLNQYRQELIDNFRLTVEDGKLVLQDICIVVDRDRISTFPISVSMQDDQFDRMLAVHSASISYQRLPAVRKPDGTRKGSPAKCIRDNLPLELSNLDIVATGLAGWPGLSEVGNLSVFTRVFASLPGLVDAYTGSNVHELTYLYGLGYFRQLNMDRRDTLLRELSEAGYSDLAKWLEENVDKGLENAVAAIGEVLGKESVDSEAIVEFVRTRDQIVSASRALRIGLEADGEEGDMVILKDIAQDKELREVILGLRPAAMISREIATEKLEQLHRALWALRQVEGVEGQAINIFRLLDGRLYIYDEYALKNKAVSSGMEYAVHRIGLEHAIQLDILKNGIESMFYEAAVAGIDSWKSDLARKIAGTILREKIDMRFTRWDVKNKAYIYRANELAEQVFELEKPALDTLFIGTYNRPHGLETQLQSELENHRIFGYNIPIVVIDSSLRHMIPKNVAALRRLAKRYKVRIVHIAGSQKYERAIKQGVIDPLIEKYQAVLDAGGALDPRVRRILDGYANTVMRESFNGVVDDVNGLWQDLIRNGYIQDAKDKGLGRIQAKFKALEKASDMELGSAYEGERDEIFRILQEAPGIIEDGKINNVRMRNYCMGNTFRDISGLRNFTLLLNRGDGVAMNIDDDAPPETYVFNRDEREAIWRGRKEKYELLIKEMLREATDLLNRAINTVDDFYRALADPTHYETLRDLERKYFGYSPEENIGLLAQAMGQVKTLESQYLKDKDDLARGWGLTNKRYQRLMEPLASYMVTVSDFDYRKRPRVEKQSGEFKVLPVNTIRATRLIGKRVGDTNLPGMERDLRGTLAVPLTGETLERIKKKKIFYVPYPFILDQDTSAIAQLIRWLDTGDKRAINLQHTDECSLIVDGIGGFAGDVYVIFNRAAISTLWPFCTIGMDLRLEEPPYVVWIVTPAMEGTVTVAYSPLAGGQQREIAERRYHISKQDFTEVVGGIARDFYKKAVRKFYELLANTPGLQGEDNLAERMRRLGEKYVEVADNLQLDDAQREELFKEWGIRAMLMGELGIQRGEKAREASNETDPERKADLEQQVRDMDLTLVRYGDDFSLYHVRNKSGEDYTVVDTNKNYFYRLKVVGNKLIWEAVYAELEMDELGAVPIATSSSWHVLKDKDGEIDIASWETSARIEIESGRYIELTRLPEEGVEAIVPAIADEFRSEFVRRTEEKISKQIRLDGEVIILWPDMVDVARHWRETHLDDMISIAGDATEEGEAAEVPQQGPIGKKATGSYQELWEAEVKLETRDGELSIFDEWEAKKDAQNRPDVEPRMFVGLSEVIKELVREYCLGILAVIDAVRIVDNIGAGALQTGTDGIVPYTMMVKEDGRNVLLVDIDLISSDEVRRTATGEVRKLLYFLLEHELSESIMTVVPCEKPGMRELTTNYMSLKLALERDITFDKKTLDEMGADFRFFAALEALRSKIETGKEITSEKDKRKILVVALEHMRNMEYYRGLFDEFSFAEDWDGIMEDVIDGESRYRAVLEIFTEVTEATVKLDTAKAEKAGTVRRGLDKLQEGVEVNVKVVKTFTGSSRVTGLEGLPRFLQGMIGVFAKVIWGRGRLVNSLKEVAGRQSVQENGQLWIVADGAWTKQYRERIGEDLLNQQIETLQNIRDGNGEQLFRVVDSIEEVMRNDPDAFSETNPRVINLFDMFDYEDIVRTNDMLYFPTLYNVGSSLFMAAHVLIVKGQVDSIQDGFTKGLIKGLYSAVLGSEPTDSQLRKLFRAPWEILPDIVSLIDNLDALRAAVVQIEKAA